MTTIQISPRVPVPKAAATMILINTSSVRSSSFNHVPFDRNDMSLPSRVPRCRGFLEPVLRGDEPIIVDAA